MDHKPSKTRKRFLLHIARVFSFDFGQSVMLPSVSPETNLVKLWCCGASSKACVVASSGNKDSGGKKGPFGTNAVRGMTLTVISSRFILTYF